MKWINIQIFRHILPTNYTVNKYKARQDPGCSFCSNHSERLIDLLWGCPEVGEFWTMIGNIISFYFPGFKLGQKEAIFGDVNSSSNSIINVMLILAKEFIWKQKFGAKNLNEINYINFMRKELRFLYDIAEFKEDKYSFFAEWCSIFEHFEVELI